MRVIFADHTGGIGGAERSLLTLLDALNAEVEPIAACPAGPLAEAIARRGLPVHEMRGTTVSWRLQPSHVARGAGQIAVSVAQLVRLSRRTRAELVHATGLRAGFIASLAHRVGAAPTVVYVHEMFRERQPIAGAVRGALRAGSALIVANSRCSAQALDLGGSVPVRVAYPGVHRQSSAIDSATARSRLEISATEKAIGLIGQISPIKGQDVALHALSLLGNRWPAANLLLIGETKFTGKMARFDSAGYLKSLHLLVRELNLDGRVRFAGELSDAAELMTGLDVLLVPSLEETFGRVVVEGWIAGVPVVATNLGGPAELIEHGRDGLLVPQRDPLSLSQAVDSILSDPKLALRLSKGGRQKAERFSAEHYAKETMSAYRDALGSIS